MLTKQLQNSVLNAVRVYHRNNNRPNTQRVVMLKLRAMYDAMFALGIDKFDPMFVTQFVTFIHQD